jgi:hypothetical protein
MAVDFSLLPKEEKQYNEAPSGFAWTIAFLLLVFAGVFAVLLLWPKGMPTQTWKFWVTLTLFPVGIPTWIVLRRYSVHEGRKLDIELNNETVRAFNTCVFEAASSPLAVLGAAHRISSDVDENAPDRIKQGAVVLKAQESIAKYGEVVKARWLSVPGIADGAGQIGADLQRRYELTRWLMEQLLDDLIPALKTLPARVPLRVHLSLANGFTPEDNEILWRTCWDTRMVRQGAVVHSEHSPADLMLIDRWMDAVIAHQDMHAKLLLAVQLHPLLAATPPSGSAEAGVALLLAPDAVATRFSMARQGDLHRPVRSPIDQADEALLRALQWGKVPPDRIVGAWQTGLDAAQAGALRLPARKLALNARVTDLDQTVGRAGWAAPWLAMACAAAISCDESAPQMIFVGQPSAVDCAVLKPANVGAPPSQRALGASAAAQPCSGNHCATSLPDTSFSHAQARVIREAARSAHRDAQATTDVRGTEHAAL